jgi:hypothetical protein
MCGTQCIKINELKLDFSVGWKILGSNHVKQNAVLVSVDALNKGNALRLEGIILARERIQIRHHTNGLFVGKTCQKENEENEISERTKTI